MTRRKHSAEFKREAVQVAQQAGVTKKQVAAELGIHPTLLRKWSEQFESGAWETKPGTALKSGQTQELERLRRELNRVKTERDILKKAPGLLREGTLVRYGFMARHRSIWPVRVMCRMLEVSHAGFYDWFGRGPSAHAVENERLVGLIRASFAQSDLTYGSPRVWRDLAEWGETASENRVARLMGKHGIRARPKRRRLSGDTGVRPEHAIAANLLDRDFAATAPNQKWVADFTYVWTAEGWLYVAVVLDLFSRRVVGWSMSAQMTAQLVVDALIMAIWRRGRPRELLHHSDQGSQYTAEEFQRLLAAHGIQCSMSRRGDCWDNAAMESFFSTLKIERVNRTRYRTRDEARANIFDYIERFYNPRRRHSTLGQLSPVEFEKRWAS
ncbi:MAG: IS3 family transposase [Gammaproteobacteria bacterium]